ncbi:MAG: ABC transporter permease, partial [Cutibacterium sp.]|nr:ABC transporter permease [Cutibacterium sp.]
MVAQVLKHQWATTLVPLRKGAKPAEIFGLIFLVLVSLFLGGNYFAYVWAAGQLAIDPRGASTAVAGASLIVFWITVPVLFGAQPTYTDPSRYAVFSRRARELMPAFVVVGLLSWGGVVTLVASVSHVLAWSSARAVAMVAAVLGVLLGWSAAMIASNL